MAMTAPGAAVTTFGTGEPDAPGAFGLVSERGVLWLANANPADEPEKKKKKNEVAEPVEITVNRLMPADALHIRGLHNASNALAALALCRSVGLPLAPLLHGLREYKGEPHRVELVTSIDNVEYYDDSKGTNVGATVAALEGLGKTFGETERQILLIAGGDGKGQDFGPLAGPCSRYVRAVLLIGRDGPAIRAALEPSGVPCFDLPGLPEAVRRASGLAKSGDVVLLSPACASLDMFTNYAHRAQVFVDAVRDIALEKGQEI
jgi:UDP-N-acetylmuramoylalanine--D-glutamate ligase